MAWGCDMCYLNQEDDSHPIATQKVLAVTVTVYNCRVDIVALQNPKG